MSVAPIVTWPDPRLEQACDEIRTFGSPLRQLTKDLLDTMYEARGRGLAAPQIGVMKRVFVMDISWKETVPEPKVFINPGIERHSDLKVSGAEACLSIPGVETDVQRFTWIEAIWQDHDGETHRQRFDGFASICFQHELDHLNGKLTLDHLQPKDRARVVSNYKARLV